MRSRSLTAKPFAMNLWVSMEDAAARTSDAAAFRRALSHLSPHIEALGGPQPHLHRTSHPFEDQARVLFDAKRSRLLVHLRYSSKRRYWTRQGREGSLRSNGYHADEAIALDQAGVDVVVASGFEAGGTSRCPS